MNKICTVCKENKSLELYHVKSAGFDGRMSECKACNAKRAKSIRAERPVKIKEWMTSWRSRNRESIIAYEKANRSAATARLAKYRAKKLQATVITDDEEFNEFVMNELYDLAKSRTDATGINWHVDHIVPIQSKIVCGFHCYRNLRVITAKENQMKSNVYWEFMP